MADISHLSGLAASEPLDMETYPVSRERTFPKAGTYILQAPDSFVFGQSKAGALTATLNTTIVGPEHSGFEVRYVRVSAKTFPRGKGPDGKTLYASQVGDYLKACAVEGQVGSDPQSIANAIESTAGRNFRAVLDWRAYNKNNPTFQVRGMENFPVDENGQPQPWTTDPDDIDPETNQPRRVWANLEVVKFLAAN